MNASRHLVSILIPAYNERFFAEAFSSALAQTYSPVEIIVADDSSGTAIEEVVARAADPRVRYVRNRERLGFGGNFSQCLALARGEFIKFLNDDDRLRPSCVEALAGVLAANPGVALATSRRALIDQHGNVVDGDIVATTPLALVNALFPGIELGNFVLANSTNYVGEPTTVLFRRASVELEDGLLFRWGGHDYHCLADLSLWLRLLLRGPAFYVAWTLSEFRLHDGQEQRKPEVAMSCLTERWIILRKAREAGYLAPPILYRAALERARAGMVSWMRTKPPSGADKQILDGLLVELDRELATIPQ